MANVTFRKRGALHECVSSLWLPATWLLTFICIVSLSQALRKSAPVSSLVCEAHSPLVRC